VKNNIEREIAAIVSEVSGVDEAEITLETDFAKDLEIDSIKAIEITVAIEKKFKISVRDEDVPNIMTLRQAVDLVTQLLEQKSSANG
jgi:acyl carrier protein